MYRDLALVKKHSTRVKYDDYLNKQIEAVCDLTGGQKASIMRELIEIGLSKFHDVDVSVINQSKEGQLKALL